MSSQSLLWSCIRYIPSPILNSIALLGSQLHYWLDTKHVRICEAMVELSNIEVSPKKVIRDMYRHLWKLLPEIVWASKVDDTEFFKRILGHEAFLNYVDQVHY